MTERPIVDVQDLSRRFGSTVALDRVSFRASEARVYGLVGTNGAGKTTLIKHLLGLLRPSSGAVRVFGLDPVRHPVDVLQRIGYLSEDHELQGWMRVDELMRYTEAYYPSWDRAFARELLRTFELDGAARIRNLSKGMRARAGLVAAVAHRPGLLLLDEPSSGLDAAVRQDILDAIVRTVADDGRTVLFSSHLLDEVERMSDHVTMIHEGRIVLDGDCDRIKESYRRSSVRFAASLDRAPAIAEALSVEGGGRSFIVLHEGPVESLYEALARLGGEIVQSRSATLEEIFLARVGRRSHAEAA